MLLEVASSSLRWSSSTHCHTGREISHSSLVSFSCFLLLSTLVSFWNASLAKPIPLRILASLFLSSIKTHGRNSFDKRKKEINKRNRMQLAYSKTRQQGSPFLEYFPIFILEAVTFINHFFFPIRARIKR